MVLPWHLQNVFCPSLPGPCTVNDDDMRQNNIAFKYNDKKKLYSTHNDVIEFKCTKGRPLGTMRQRCDDGVMLLPTCQ